MYAILSHRWGDEEVTFQDIQDGKGPSRGAWKKIAGCCRKAASDGYEFAVSIILLRF
jgi:hypothetical protein